MVNRPIGAAMLVGLAEAAEDLCGAAMTDGVIDIAEARAIRAANRKVVSMADYQRAQIAYVVTVLRCGTDSPSARRQYQELRSGAVALVVIEADADDDPREAA